MAEPAGDHRMRILLDANVIARAGDVFTSRGHDVERVGRIFPDGTPDDDIDAYARGSGRIIVSHDQRFLKRIQQPRFNFADTVASGYGRIMLSGPESQQRLRLEQTLPIIELLHIWAVAEGRRFLLTIGPTWVRVDDQPLTQVDEVGQSV